MAATTVPDNSPAIRATVDVQPCHLLNLSAELRNEIWSLALYTPRGLGVYLDDPIHKRCEKNQYVFGGIVLERPTNAIPERRRSSLLALTETNKQIRAESYPLLFVDNTICIGPPMRKQQLKYIIRLPHTIDKLINTHNLSSTVFKVHFNGEAEPWHTYNPNTRDRSIENGIPPAKAIGQLLGRNLELRVTFGLSNLAGRRWLMSGIASTKPIPVDLTFTTKEQTLEAIRAWIDQLEREPREEVLPALERWISDAFEFAAATVDHRGKQS